MVSVIIPARNEIYLEKTIRSVLETAHGEVEVLVMLDGYKPEYPIDMSGERVTFYYYDKAIGQRPAVNEGARRAKGKYIMKLDAHCMMDDGWDEKLKADCKPNWIVTPRHYVLDAENWVPKWRKRNDFMFIRSPYAKDNAFRIAYYDASTARECPETYHKAKKARWLRGDVAPTMACIGACWFLHRDYYWEIEGMDEAAGHWGQMGVELGCKAWLSGGALMVNKKTWYAHQHHSKFPWPASARQQEATRKYSLDFWTNNRWQKQIHPLTWLYEKFAPVPTWDENDLTILYYTANVASKEMEREVISRLKKSINGQPIISISQKPMDLGTNICVGDTGRSLQNIYRQVLVGAEKATTEYVALVEDDCFYTPEHFEYRPKADFAYNLNRWLLHKSENVFSYRKRPILSQCIAKRVPLIKNLKERFELPDIPNKYCGEMGVFDKKLGMTEYPYETFSTAKPNVVICHEKNIMGRKLKGKDAAPVKVLEDWGTAEDLINSITVKEEVMPLPKFGRGAKPRSQHCYVGSVIFDINDISENRLDFAIQWKIDAQKRFLKAFPPFIQKVADGQEFTKEQLVEQPYFDYLVTALNPSDRNPLTGKGKRHVLKKMRDAINLYYDIKDFGLKAPLDMWREGDRYVLWRGGRRLEIMKILGKKTVPARIYKTKRHYQIFNAPAGWHQGSWESNKIHDLGMKQFMKLEHLATDKYWVHNYTVHYDHHLGHLQDEKLKILEIGVFRGASLLLWKDAFPKSQIYGIDKNTRVWKEAGLITDEVMSHNSRIKVFHGRQEDTDFLRKDVVPHGKFDIIIDDGGHKGFEQQPSFDILWDSLNEGGWYIIEDLYGMYRRDVRRTDRERGFRSTIDYLKDKVDDQQLKSTIKSMTFYYNICFVEKM
jgi:glycosyltransferase involved in cell wall biosynthesis